MSCAWRASTRSETGFDRIANVGLTGAAISAVSTERWSAAPRCRRGRGSWSRGLIDLHSHSHTAASGSPQANG